MLMFVCRNVFWVSNFLHLLLPYFDYFLCDGSHGFSKHGWKYQPLCIKTSGGSLVPIAAVWGLEEETASFVKLIDMCRAHCAAHGVDSSAFARRVVPLGNIAIIEVMPFAILVYTLIMIAQDSGDSEMHETAKSLYRTYQYHPKWEKCFVAAMDDSISDDIVLAMIPSILFIPTLHCDSGTALISLIKYVYWNRTSCAKHMEPNVASLNQTLKESAMTLLYGRNISTAMVYEIRDKLINGCTSTTNLAAPTRKWVLANFGTDEAMHVCVHTSQFCVIFSHSCCRPTRRRFAISFFHLVIPPTLPWNCGSEMPKVTKKSNSFLERE